ncbi:DUF1456 family protein [Vibrio sp. WJH972]
MINNEILRQIQQTFELSPTAIVGIFNEADQLVSVEQVELWLATTEATLLDVELAQFLNGFINTKRGRQDGKQAIAETALSNNMVLMKLRIAVNMQTEQMLNAFETVGCDMTKYELGALFRKPSNKHFRECSDTILSDFLLALRS